MHTVLCSLAGSELCPGRWQAAHLGKPHTPSLPAKPWGHRLTNRVPVSWETQRSEQAAGGLYSTCPYPRDIAIGCIKFWLHAVQVKTAQEAVDSFLFRSFFQ